MDGSRRKKRSRSSTPTTKGDSPPKKKNKSNKAKSKNKSKKSSRSTNNSNAALSAEALSSSAQQADSIQQQHHHKSSLDSTATADGQMMAQMLSTFTKLEQSRFEAFKRVTFDQARVQEWIAACLMDRRGGGTGGMQQMDTVANGSLNHQRRSLSDLVMPGQASEIGLVVSCLAKIYAQRLVAAAFEYKEKSDEKSSSSVGEKGTATTDGTDTDNQKKNDNNDNNNSIQPHHILKAYEERVRTGEDPGFFLQANYGAVQLSQNRLQEHELRRSAALQVQEEYDAYMKEQEEEEEEKDDSKMETEEESKKSDDENEK